MKIKFLKNKYYEEYFKLINGANLLQRKKSKLEYFERHHILPTALGGNNKNENKVLLTGQEHYRAHYLLTKMLTEGSEEWAKMSYCFLKMNFKSPNRMKRNIEINSELFAYARKLQSKATVIFWTGRKHSEESKRKMSISAKKRFEDPLERKLLAEKSRGKKASDETKKKMSESQKKNMTPEMRSRISATLTGHIPSEEHRRNLSKKKMKKCTIDGIKIYNSRKSLIQELGCGKNGAGSKNFRYVLV